ncbi:glycosyltransferase, partial [Candidatus Gracilibacteria bacterium]|nr:glycosyltransferase [Candidatus Gracilibacteria bacterium]
GLSKGKFIHFHDSDDSITPDWLIKIIRTLQKQKNTDLLLTGRIDRTDKGDKQTHKRFFDKNRHKPKKIARRLLYWNCIGPIGGVIFSRKILENIPFKRFASSQDWQMYLNALEHSQILASQPDIQFIFNKTGDDRISHNPRKKVLGFLQYARLTEKKSVFKRQIRLFYLYRCRQHIFQQGGGILKFYKSHRGRIFISYLIVSAYSFLAF